MHVAQVDTLWVLLGGIAGAAHRFHRQNNLHFPDAYLLEFSGIKERANVNSILYRCRLDMILWRCAVRLLEFKLRMKL
jgi:hypothetical protein